MLQHQQHAKFESAHSRSNHFSPYTALLNVKDSEKQEDVCMLNKNTISYNENEQTAPKCFMQKMVGQSVHVRTIGNVA